MGLNPAPRRGIQCESGYVQDTPEEGSIAAIGYPLDLDNDGAAANIKVTAPGKAFLIAKIEVPAGFAFQYPVATGWGYGIKSYGSDARLKFSPDGINWSQSSVPGSYSGWYKMELDTAGDANYAAVDTLWLNIAMDCATVKPEYGRVQSVVVTGTLVAAPQHVCGEAGTAYLEADVNEDCYIDIYDIGVLAGEWLD